MAGGFQSKISLVLTDRSLLGIDSLFILQNWGQLYELFSSPRSKLIHSNHSSYWTIWMRIRKVDQDPHTWISWLLQAPRQLNQRD